MTFIFRSFFRDVPKGLFIFLSLSLSLLRLQAQDFSLTHSWNPDSLGNRRAVVKVLTSMRAAQLTINWQWHDDPTGNAVRVIDARTNRLLRNVKAEQVSKVQVTIWFEPVSGPGIYYIYSSAPETSAASGSAKAMNDPTENGRTSSQWPEQCRNAGTAKLLYLESANALNSSCPMEITATEQETKRLISGNPGKTYLLFTEDRVHPVPMKHGLPQRWTDRKAKPVFHDVVLRGKNFAYQIAVFPVRQDLKDLKVKFSDLSGQHGHRISADGMSCFTIGTMCLDQRSYPRTVNIERRNVHSLWCVVNIPAATREGAYTGTVVLSASNAKSRVIQIRLRVKSQTAARLDVDQPDTQTRVGRRNPKTGQQNEAVRYVNSLVVDSNSLSCVGRKITINKFGFPEQIQTFFTPELTEISTASKNLLTEGMHFHIISGTTHKDLEMRSDGWSFSTKTPETVSWEANSHARDMDMKVSATAGSDGSLTYTVRLTALNDLDLEDIKFHIPFTRSTAKYLIGLGNTGHKRPDTLSWRWNASDKTQDGAWIGDINGGLQYALLDAQDVPATDTISHLQRPRFMPASWGNSGKGGIWVGLKGNSILSENYSGKRTMKKGGVLYYNFVLLVTPVML